MGRITRRFDRMKRPLKITIQLAILSVILIAIGTVGFIEYSAQPGFCDNCHNMKPYYDSWMTSTHNSVKCIECHYPPGIKAEAMGKLQAANQVVKYITGAYGTKPWAEIEDAACLRSGCHTERELEGEVSFAGVRFDHTHHLGELRRGKDLRCTSCHSQIVQGSHLTVTAETCYLCHFKDRPAAEPIAGCTGCHAAPPRLRSATGFVVDHPLYVDQLVSCIGCHEKVTSGSGVADRDRCFSCHNEPDRLETFENTTLVHRLHIATHNVECAQCHTPILHQVTAVSETFELDCQSCHQRAHDEQRQMYAGMGGHGTPNHPSSMFLARVACQSCHGIPTDVPGHAEVTRAGEATCLSCHGVGYANILPAWKREMDSRLNSVKDMVDAARRRLDAAPAASRPRADSLLRLAAENVGFVERSGSAHNISYADQLLRASVKLVQEAVREGQLRYSVPDLDFGPPIGSGSCLQCHIGIEERSARFKGAAFRHSPHVKRGGLNCSECHTPLEQHGGITLASRASCNDCHHRTVEPLDCAVCHTGPGGAPRAPIATEVGDFPHQKHRAGGFACAACHQPPTMSASGVQCEACHELHHEPQKNCLACHRGGVLQIHPSLAHNGCAPCHGQKAAGITGWSRQVCTVCHADKLEHNAPADCHLCHTMPELGGP